MIHAQVNTTTRQILALGYFPAGHEDPNIEIVDVDESAMALLDEPGDKHLNVDGTITVTPPDTSAEDTARAAQETTEAQRHADAETIMAVLPNQAAQDAMARLLRLN